MYLFSKKFWDDLHNDPRESIDTLRLHKHRVWYHIVKTITYWRIVFSEYGINHCTTRASALSYVLLLTLIPLVVTSAFMMTSLVEVRPKQVEDFFSILLPFAPDTILNFISEFFVNARKIQGWGFAGLIIVAVGLFGAVEESFNTIWKVTTARSFFIRLRTFTMVMVYSPILFYLSFRFRSSSWLDFLSHYFFPIDVLPFLLMVMAFTTLIWFVPHTKVRFRSAFLGGLFACILFEIERRGFGHYVAMQVQTQTIYGTLAILPLFLVSIYFLSIFILFGTQVAYVHQNFRPLLRAKKRWDRRVGDYKTYILFRMVLDSVDAFLHHKTPPTLKHFSRKYEMTSPQTEGLVNWLIHKNMLHCVNGKDSYVPARDFSDVRVGEVVETIKAQDLCIPPLPNDYTRDYVAALLTNSNNTSGSPADQLTFKEMLDKLNEGETRMAKAGAAI